MPRWEVFSARRSNTRVLLSRSAESHGHDLELRNQLFSEWIKKSNKLFVFNQDLSNLADQIVRLPKLAQNVLRLVSINSYVSICDSRVVTMHEDSSGQKSLRGKSCYLEVCSELPLCYRSGEKALWPRWPGSSVMPCPHSQTDPSGWSTWSLNWTAPPPPCGPTGRCTGDDIQFQTLLNPKL